MNERQLEFVVAVVEEGSFTQAAIRCDVAQPSLSQSIARLERELGVPLFHRIGRSVSPTDACHALLAPARDVIRATQAVVTAAGGVRDGLIGRLEVAVQPTVVGTVVGLLAEFHAQLPGVTLRVRSARDDSVAFMVESGRTELGVGDLVVPRPGLVLHDLWTETYVCVDRTDGDSASMAPCTPADLSAVHLVTTPAGSPTRELLDRWFADCGIAPKIAIETDHRDALVPLVAAGVGAAIVPESIVEAVFDPRLRVRRLDPPVERRVGIIHRPWPLTPAAQRLLELAGATRH